MAEWLDKGRWVGLLDLIDMLPSASKLNEAYANDEEAAEELLTLPEASGDAAEWSPPVSEFGTQGRMLRELINETKSLRLVLISGFGGKPGQEKPFPAPVTAIARVRERLEEEAVMDLFKAFGATEDMLR